MNRNVGIRTILRPRKSAAEIAEDARADAQAMAAVVRRIGPISRHPSIADSDDLIYTNTLQPASKPIKDEFGNTAAQKTKIINDQLTKPPSPYSKAQKKQIVSKWKHKSALDFYDSPEGVDFITSNMDGISKEEASELNKKMKASLEITGGPKKDEYGNEERFNSRIQAQDELKKAEMLVSKANAKTVTQLTNLKNWSNNSKKVLK